MENSLDQHAVQSKVSDHLQLKPTSRLCFSYLHPRYSQFMERTHRVRAQLTPAVNPAIRLKSHRKKNNPWWAMNPSKNSNIWFYAYIYQCLEYTQQQFQLDFWGFFSINFRHNGCPRHTEGSPKPFILTFRLEKSCFLVYSGQNSWLAEICLLSHKHRNHYHHSCKSQACTDGWD